jgi:3-dehydroquinate synthase
MSFLYHFNAPRPFHSQYILDYGKVSRNLTTILKSISFDHIYVISDIGLPSSLIKNLANHLPLHTTFLEISCTEKDKTWATVEYLLQHFQTGELSRNGLVIAVGGGVLGDVVGFAASIYKRGIRWIFVPTTLIAQIDSSIGGKTAVNTSFGKNLLGAFHPPLFVLADIALLKSLPLRQLQSGIAEIIKIAAIADNFLFNQLYTHTQSSLSSMVPLFSRAAELKIEIAQDDPLDLKDIGRNRLNFGHTMGHAIEACLQPSILHGEAIALGMLAEIEIAKQLGQCNLDAEWCNQLEQLIKRYIPHHQGFPTLSWESLLPYLKQDKKNEKHSITLIIPDSLHQARKIKITADQILR